MKKTLLTVGVILSAAFLFFSIWTGGALNQISKSWDIEFPKDGTEVYCFNGEEGASYYAFIYEKAETAQGAFDWVTEEGATNEYDTYMEAIEVWMEEAKVPNTLPIEIPEGNYYYESKEDGSELIIVPDNRMLHIIEKVVK